MQPGQAVMGGSPDEGMNIKINVDAMQRNMREIDLVRIVMYMVAGGIAGVLGLTGIQGFILYMIVSLVIGVALPHAWALR